MKERLDLILVKKQLVPSREQARTLIMEGKVFVDGEREDKPGNRFPEDAEFEIRGKTNPFVSRGGFKLQKAVETFSLDLDGLTCMDIGASTGGFTDCMLQHGAKKVYAVDVGYNQLAWKLRQDERVVSMERTNIRYVKPEEIGEAFDFISADVAFISLSKVLPVMKELMKEEGHAVVLVKPQFEAGREKVGKKGVVRDPKVQEEVIGNVLSYAAENGFFPAGLTWSPIRGPEGNIEFLLFLSRREEEMTAVDPSRVVAEAQEVLK
ncbi:MAG: TlyA family RNA methyltransferase [Lachnospiraceae bacterium]|nr:TlyA family RNA methyltransferase [Lachnospiraceae bacterium]